MTSIPGHPAPPKLLISVRSEDEFADALESAADIIDLKEPTLGPLAPAAPELWLAVAQRWTSLASPRPWLSAALGESDQAQECAGQLPAAFAFAKAGPSGCDSPESLRQLWTAVQAGIPKATRLVAVAYADHDAADCLSASQIFELAAKTGLKHCLLDTFRKDGRSTLDHLGIDGLAALQTSLHQSSQWWALAGSLRADDVTRLYSAGVVPNCFGVRGDVCEKSRTGRLSPARVTNWQAALATPPTPIPSAS